MPSACQDDCASDMHDQDKETNNKEYDEILARQGSLCCPDDCASEMMNAQLSKFSTHFFG